MRSLSLITLAVSLSALSASLMAQPSFQYAPPPPMVHPMKGHVHAAPKLDARDMEPALSTGAGPHQSWVEGDQVPAAYRSGHYAVKNWRKAQLSAPAKGQRWVQYGADYMLVDAKTGSILRMSRIQ